jgi:signal transduction histidine kinase
MRLNFSLSLKLTLIVVSISAAVIFTLTYINIEKQASFFETAYSEKAIAFAQALDATIERHDELKDRETLQSYVSHFSEINPEILKISINLPDEDVLKVAISSDEDSIGNIASSYNDLSFENDAVVNIPSHTKDSHTLTVIVPMNLSGEIAGTYELLLSMDATYAAFDVHVRNIVMISIASLFILVFSFLFLLRKAVVKPITEFRDAARKIGAGDLQAEIKIKSRDELGELSSAFDQMTSDLKKSRAEIKRYSQMLEKLLTQKDEFIGQLGHDLKNPLTPLVGLLPIILKREKDPEIRKHLQIIIHNVEYMRDLIHKTLELAQLRSPNTKFDLQDINLMEQVKATLENQQLLLKEYNVNVKNLIDDKIYVKADKLRVVELLNNLVTNAVKFTPKDKGIITIDAEDDGNFVTVSVKDNGIGMSSDQLDKVFDEFYKADESRHEMDSSGLGLSICKRIVEKHGGRIWAESPGKGKGSTFYFTLKSGNQKNN